VAPIEVMKRMRSTSFNTARGVFLNIFIACAFLGTIALGVHAPKTLTSRIWLLSDWMINYQGGFIRRGLPGEVLYLISHTLHISLIPLIVASYLFFFGVLFFAVWRLAIGSSRNFWVIAIAVSPAFLSFQLLHPQAGYRKEIIFLAALALFALLHRNKALTSGKSTAYLVAIAVIGTLSHEATFLYLPYFVPVLLLSGCGYANTFKQVAPACIAGLLVFAVCAHYPGNQAAVSVMCQSLGYSLSAAGVNQVCGSGAIHYLLNTREFARQETLEAIARLHYFRVYPLLALIAALPLIGISVHSWLRGFRRETTIIWASFAVAFICSLILFIYGIDWGRWIYIHIASLSILLLFLDCLITDSHQNQMAETIQPGRTTQIFAVTLLVIYATTWALPNNIDETTNFGYVGRALAAVHKKTHPS
jgi:hypothetical protein